MNKTQTGTRVFFYNEIGEQISAFEHRSKSCLFNDGSISSDTISTLTQEGITIFNMPSETKIIEVVLFIK